MDRRSFVKSGMLAVGGGALLPSVSMVAPASAGPVSPGNAPMKAGSPYGPLSDVPDENGLLLPAGFTSRVVAIGGEPVGGTGYAWHPFPDGAATFDDGEGGWYYVCNSEVFDFMAPDAGGVSAIHFAGDGSIVDAYRICEGSNSNCAGGPTPWGTWLSGEENSAENGRIWECDPTGRRPAVAHEAMGRWAHEAAAVDPADERVYLTQDHPEGLLYRFTPANYPDLSAGTLEACLVADDGTVSWALLADPSGAMAPTRTQVAGARVFPGNEGIWYHDGWIYFTTKIDHSVHGIDLRGQTYRLIWQGDPDGLGVEGAVLSHVDNITVDAGSGDLVVAEDGGNMELVVLAPDGSVGPLLRMVGAGHEISEITGPVFNPTRDRLYFSSQRGPSVRTLGELIPAMVVSPEAAAAGVTYEITGPFRGRIEGPVVPGVPETAAIEPITDEAVAEPKSSPVDTLAAAASESRSGTDGTGGTDEADGTDGTDGGVGSSWIGFGLGAAAVAAFGGAVVVRRRRMGEAEAPESRSVP